MNEENKSNKILLNRQNKKVKNEEKEKFITLNINVPIIKENNENNIDIFLGKYCKTISFNKSKYVKFFSTFMKRNQILKNQKSKKKNKIEILSDKNIQTPNFFFRVNKIVINSLYISCYPNKKTNIYHSAFPNRNIFKKLKSNKSSPKLKSSSLTKSLIEKYFKLNNNKSSRNKLSPIDKFRNIQKSDNKKLNYHLTNDIITNQNSKKLKHRNLFNIENIYKQQKKLPNNLCSNKGTQNEPIFKKIPSRNLKK